MILAAMAAACSGTGPTCTELDCDDGNPCTNDACDPSGMPCENATKADWSPCDLDGRRAACDTGVCAELEWPADLEEHQRIEALCQDRSIEDCEEDARCDHLTAGRFDPALVCLEPTDEVGCASAFRICGLSLTTAESPDGVLYRFPDTCLPDGWEPAYNELRAFPVSFAGSCEQLTEAWPDDEEAQSIRKACEGLVGGQCNQDECRTVFPLRVDDERTCLEISSDHEVCTSRFRMCDPTPTVARTSDGESFVIGNGCVLESWEVTGSLEGEQSHIFSWPTCAVQ